MADYRLEFWPTRSPQAPIAFLTMARDENILLEAWVKNGLRICPEAAFYVLDHASSPALSESLAGKPDYNDVNLNFVNIPPVPFDDDFKAMAMSGFAKMLLHCYDIVVATDCDELLVGLGIGADEVLPKLQSLGEITAPIGFEVVQHTDKEAPYDPSQDIELQRGYGFFTSGYTKPVIWKARSEFGAGLHRSREDFAYETSLGLLHLRSVDQGMSLERAAQRRDYEISVGQVDQGRGGNWLAPPEKKVDFFARLRSLDVIPTFNDLLEGFHGELTHDHHKNSGGFWGHNISWTSDYCDISGVLYVRPSGQASSPEGGDLLAVPDLATPATLHNQEPCPEAHGEQPHGGHAECSQTVVTGGQARRTYEDRSAAADQNDDESNGSVHVDTLRSVSPSAVARMKIVPLQLTLGNATQAEGALTGTARYPMKWNAQLQRVRVNIQNVHPSTGKVKTGAVDFSGLWVGKHGTKGAFATAPTQIHSAFSSPADGSKWTSKWFSLDQQPGVEDLLSIGYTASSGTVFNINGAGWTNADPGVAGQQAPPMASHGMLPFYIWLEAETDETTEHFGVMGDSLASGVGAAHVQNSWLSQYCYAKGALPTHYSNSGDALESWAKFPDHFKWTVFDGLALPKAVVIAGAANDLNDPRKTNAEIQGYFNAVADRFRAKGITTLYAANIIPRTSGNTPDFDTKRQAHNQWLLGLPGDVRAAFNFSAAVSADDKTLLPEYDHDGVHLKAAGYAAMAASITHPI